MLSHAFSIIIDHGISAPVNNIEVVDGLKEIDKSFIFQLISNVQLSGKNSMTHICQFTLEPVHLMLVWPDKLKTYLLCSTQTWSDLSRQISKGGQVNGIGQKGGIMFSRMPM